MVSVIIPAHNAEKTIERSVVSATEQISDAEIIVVENGSSDGTAAVVETLQKKYRNVKLIYSETGVSKARNAGLKYAAGEWIVFLDADDYLEDHIGAIIDDCMSDSSVDLWMFGHNAGSEARSVTESALPEIYDADSVTRARVKMLENPTRYMQVWGKLFQNAIIQREDLWFNEKLSLSEDSDFTLRYTRHCKKICFSPAIIYHYSLDNPSVMRQYDSTKAKRYALAMLETKKHMEDEPYEIKQAFRKYVLMHMNIAMVRDVFAAGNAKGATKKRKRMSALIGEEAFAEAIKQTKPGDCLSLRMLPVLFIKGHLDGLAAFLYRVRAKQNARRERKG